MKLVGFVGTGKMGGALASAVIKKVGGENVVLSDAQIEKAQALANESSCEYASSLEVSKGCKYVFLGVKPQVMEKVANELKDALCERKDKVILVSMAAGICIERIESMFGNLPVIRIMPNTPAAVGEGMILYTANQLVSEDELNEFCCMLSCAGKLDKIDEKLIDAASAVSGCGPAFVYLFMQAMADGGVQCGLPRDKALAYAEQTVLGAATLAIRSGTHPEQLKDDVCSPGGTTIEGVRAMEEGGVRAAVMNAVSAAFEKSKKL